MTFQELIDEQRSILDDQTGPPYLWTDADLLRYNNKTIDRLAGEAYLITDAATAAVCQIALTLLLGAHYTKSAKIIQIREVTLSGYTLPLTRRDLNWFKSHYPTWRSAAVGTPRMFTEEITTGKITFIPAPDANYTANLVVYRRPLDTEKLLLTAMSTGPVIPEQYHRYILNGVLSQAYGKQDAETFDKNLQLKYEVLFEKDVAKAFRENSLANFSSTTASPHKGFIG